VFISDNNRFGQGSFLARLAKLALCKARLWSTLKFVQTRGKMYSISEGVSAGAKMSKVPVEKVATRK
jgi:hypothetical protein